MNKITEEELNRKIALHKKWLENNPDGEQLVLTNYDLNCSDLSNSDLSNSNLRGSNLQGSDLRYSDLSNSDLSNSDLRDSDLRGSDFDYSCFPLWCGGSHFLCDIKLIYQLLSHICTLQCEDTEFSEIREKILPYAKKSHRATDLGLTK